MIRLGLTNELISLPITMNLTTFLPNSEFQIQEQSLQKNYLDLIRKKLDAAFIAPSDYARDSTLLKLAKNIVIYNKGESRYSILFFRKNLVEIEEIAYQSDSHYKDLAFLLLREFFEMDPEWKLVTGGSHTRRVAEATPGRKGKIPIETLLESYQAVLQNGADALENYPKLQNKIDVIDQWWDKTGLSFVHQVFALNNDVEETQWLDRIYQSRDSGMKNLEQISESYGKYHEHSSEFYLDLLQNIYHYTTTENMWKQCAEYFKYLFYYGKIPFIPEFHFV